MVDTLEVEAMGFQIDELSKEGNSAQVSKRLTALSTRRGTMSRSPKYLVMHTYMYHEIRPLAYHY